ncbi:HAD family hydrolase [Bdellovibrio sp. 22V]|uniref:HAD family hydrolase n=1 Tax=Bdellovibrio TaxID=958 RepID=UPI00254272CE|nr:HAD family hydrolase [Bdellovibrio sp. 22V]WII71608.1 HAD family hydrolase [Bdellovibrio sp. 22V]
MKNVFFFLLVVFCLQSAVAATDPLPSWNNGEIKQSIIKFVEDVSRTGSPTFVKPEDRIATFDNDGTLWSEVPTVEVEFTKVRLQEVLEKDPSLKNKEPYKSLLAKGKAALPMLSQKQILDIMARTHSGMSEEEFEEQVRSFFETARHPKLQVPYTQTTYKPMLELLSYLRENGFKTFISSGGDIAFMRAVAFNIYSIPPENIIGSFFVDKTIEKNGRLEVMRTANLGLMNDKENKPVGIVRHIGKRPIFSAGNVRSGGDVEMLRYSSEGQGRTLQLMINHDDVDREAAYQEKDGRSLAAAKKFGWKVVSMKSDWKQVFATEQPLAKRNK